MDNRKALSPGEELIFDSKKKYIIIEETGRGASCLVYTASCRDSVGLTHIVRIKECFPYYLELKRAGDNTLQVSDEFRQQFEEEKEKFCRAYKKNVQIKNTLGLMNSTVDSMELCELNYTLYCVSGIIEGADYRQDGDSYLRDIFVRMETLCEIVRKYHNKGYLHLDIKPENILILPETREHIVLFDFDSVVLKEDLRNGTETRLSFSGGYSAPELRGKRREKIDGWTDIYSVGAVVYSKIFGKTPDEMGCPLGKKFDFSEMRFADKRYQPELYKKLNIFLQKTLATSTYCRYQSMEEVISDLRELQRFSDTEAVVPCSNFSYHSAYFVGRQRELVEIEEAFTKNQVVFLSGMGGIGKTELAKKYAHERQEEYGKIIFAGFYRSIRETVCGQDFEINGIARGEEESLETFFERKLGVLKTVLTKKDLIILDNFDVEADEDLERLLDCPCRFLITTREDFRDYNYRQITIDKMEDIGDLVDLVKVYNEEKYTDKEMNCIEHIIEVLEYHTMTVELAAKYLHVTGEAPSALWKRIESVWGIVNTEEDRIRHRKDKKLRAESIVRHLMILFDLSGFSAEEEEIMMSLSLLGAVRVRRETFLEYCGINGCKANGLDNLIRRGWIEFDEETGKVSLHQIILDLIYNDKKPTAKKCPGITAAMTEYAGKRCENQTEKEVKRRLLYEFAQRINGDELELAQFLTAYCKNVRRNREYMERAQRICEKYLEENSIQTNVCAKQYQDDEEYLEKNSTQANLRAKQCQKKEDKGKKYFEKNNAQAADQEKEDNGKKYFEKNNAQAADMKVPYKKEEDIHKTYSKQRIYRLMYEIYSIKIAIEAEYKGMLWSDLEEMEYLNEKSSDILSIAKEAYVYLQDGGYNEEEAGRRCVALAFELDNAASRAEMYLDENERCDALERLLDYASYLLEDAGQHLLRADMPYTEKEKLFEKIQNFYSGEDYCALYRSENYEDLEKVWYYQEILDKLRLETEKKDMLYLHSGDITYFETAKKAEQKGEYEKAEYFYKKELDEGETLYEMVWDALADMYQKMGRTDEATECLKTILRMDRKRIASREDNWRYSSYISAKLSRLLLSQGKKEEAKSYLRELIFYNEGQEEEDWIIFGNYYLYKIEEREDERERLWKVCLEDYKRLRTDREVPDYLTDFMIEYLYSLPDRDEQIQNVILTAKCCKTQYYSEEKERLISCMLDICKTDKSVYIKLLIQYAENLRLDIENPKHAKDALEICEQAQKLYKESGIEDAYLYSLIQKNIGESLLHLDDYDAGCEALKKCNYYLLAQTQLTGGYENYAKNRNSCLSAQTQLGEEHEKLAAELWEEAAEAYAFLENWELAEQCYKERFSLSDAAPNWQQSGSFDKCWSLGIKRLRGLLLAKRREDALWWKNRLLEELFTYMFESADKEKIKRSTEQSAQRLKETADILAGKG